MILGPAGCDVGSGDDPGSLDKDSSTHLAKEQKFMLENCQGTEVSLLCIYIYIYIYIYISGGPL